MESSAALPPSDYITLLVTLKIVVVCFIFYNKYNYLLFPGTVESNYLLIEFETIPAAASLMFHEAVDVPPERWEAAFMQRFTLCLKK